MSQPDILIFMSDQHSGAMMGCAGADVDTPNLDALCQHGVCFENAYTACPLCVPARMSFLSGKMPHKTGVYNNDDTLPDLMPTFLHALAAVGYETVLVGRMHFVGADQRHGFTKRIGGDYTPTTWVRPIEKMVEYRGQYAKPVWFASVKEEMIGGGESSVTFYDRMVIQKALEYMSEPHEKPQCIVVGTYGPHFPYIAPHELYEKYKAKVMLPADFRDFPEKFRDFIGYRSMKVTDAVARRARAAYSALIEIMDGQVGLVREEFQKMAKRDGRERFFVYTSDHGDMNGHKGIYGKYVLYDDSTRIPLLIEGDGIPSGLRVKGNVSILDIAPTVCEWGGAAALAGFDGISLTNYFDKDRIAENERSVMCEIYDKYVDPVYWENPIGAEPLKTAVPEYGTMTRKGKWKFVRYCRLDGKDAQALYDMEQDPQERCDLSEALPDITSELRELGMRMNNVDSLTEQQRIRAQNANLFRAYERATDFGLGELWTDNPPMGRVKPCP